MEAKGLMIGDWVTFTNEWSEKYLIKYGVIAEIYGRYVAVKVGERLYQLPIFAILPIPLTEEILLANGFNHQISMNNVDHGWNLGNVWLTKDLELFVYKTHIKLSYVHELQHALRQCELNEIADNFKVEGGNE